MKYHITTYGCQMNVSDSRRLATELERLGCDPAEQAEDADVIVVASRSDISEWTYIPREMDEQAARAWIRKGLPAKAKGKRSVL